MVYINENTKTSYFVILSKCMAAVQLNGGRKEKYSRKLVVWGILRTWKAHEVGNA